MASPNASTASEATDPSCFRVWWWRLSHWCRETFGNCFFPNNTEDDQLLHEGPSHSNSAAIYNPEDLGPHYYPSPNVRRSVHQLTVEEQMIIAHRIGLIHQLPIGSYDGCKKNRECVICMVEFMVEDKIKYLPCLHFFHQECIDDWLMRSLTCPSCLEPVDAALLNNYES